MENFVLGWFSCGITSAVACKLALEQFPRVELYYMEIDSAHPDNVRFLDDCERWYGQPIRRVRSQRYKDQFEVIRKTRYINGPNGARCTTELKKNVRFELEEQFRPTLLNLGEPTYIAQIHGFEFKVEEIKRALDYALDYEYTNPVFPLIEARLTKENCAQILLDAGIQLPTMYKLGYNNNNCIGCVKGGKGYWNKIRVDFPEHFLGMAQLEREIGRSCIYGTFLDELDPSAGRTPNPIVPNCSVVCEDILPPDANMSIAKRVFAGALSMEEAIKLMKKGE
jgi:3'-phosphoadenosine 5'-phosphosulfate sulfotransferase (PAPS reductase)/FAD synthetase